MLAMNTLKSENTTTFTKVKEREIDLCLTKRYKT